MRQHGGLEKLRPSVSNPLEFTNILRRKRKPATHPIVMATPCKGLDLPQAANLIL